jgi:pyridinium-3,5-bisthiocarboxylic acid mononucleotide nickel chelatase
MQTLYLDLFSGISGDMFIAALLDLGVDPVRFQQELKNLNLSGYHLHIGRGHKSGISGTKFDVHLEGAHHNHTHPHEPLPHHHHYHGHEQSQPHHHPHEYKHGHEHEHPQAHEHAASQEHAHGRNFAEIRALIYTSGLSDWVKAKAVAVFQRLAEAEGKIHGVSPDEVAFHEVGAVDSIIDIVGACIALELLGRPRILAGNVVEGAGWIDCAHGRFPVPAPATLGILGARGIPVSQCEEPHELVTPTGAALLAEFAESFGPMREITPGKIGYGLGTRDHRTRPNVLRVLLGDTGPSLATHDWETDTIAVLETNLDDINPEILGHFVEKALAAGALDVFHTPVQMKKNRPAALLTVLCPEPEADKFTELLLRETSAFGVRRHTAERRKLIRKFASVQTPFGEITVKLGILDGNTIQVAPEYESCKKAAETANVPIKDVYRAALLAAPGS